MTGKWCTPVVSYGGEAGVMLILKKEAEIIHYNLRVIEEDTGDKYY